MDINTATRFVEENHADIILCDTHFVPLTASPSFSEAAKKAGCRLDEILSPKSTIVKEASTELSLNLPYLSTNFELFGHNSTIICLPIFDNQTFIAIIVYFFGAEIDSAPAMLSACSQMAQSYRSPATAILNLSATLAAKLQQDEKYEELRYLNAITQNCYSMLRVSSSAEYYYQLKNHRYKPQDEYLLLNDLLEELYKSLSAMARKLQMKLSLKLPKKAVILKADQKLINLALLHLVKNAFVYSPKESTVTISLSLSKNNAILKVTDEGIGIPNEASDRVFEPFFTLHEKALPEEQMGLGLGLPIAGEIVSLYHGRIALESAPNCGTTVAVSLPIDQTPAGGYPLSSSSLRYNQNKYSDLYMLFADICDIHFY